MKSFRLDLFKNWKSSAPSCSSSTIHLISTTPPTSTLFALFLRLIDIRSNFGWVARVDVRTKALVTPASPDGDPDMLSRHGDVAGLADPRPPEPCRAAHVAVSDAAVGAPLAQDIADELDLAAEVVRPRDSLQLWADLGPASSGVAGAAGGGARSGRGLLRHGGEVEEGLHRVRENRPIVQCGFVERAGLLEALGSVLGKVPEVAPRSGGV